MVGLIAAFVVLLGAVLFLAMARVTRTAGPEAILTVTGAFLAFVVTDSVLIALVTAGLMQWLQNRNAAITLRLSSVAH